MNAFDMIGPVMIGPSSSHTAGAVRLGYAARMILGEMPQNAEIILSGSFADTGKGHGTDKAVIAGLLGMRPDDERIPSSFEIAAINKMHFSFGRQNLSGGYANVLRIILIGRTGHHIILQGASVGGGSILITEVDGIKTALTCEMNTILVTHVDSVGVITKLTGVIAAHKVNIASIQCTRNEKGQEAITYIEIDGSITNECIKEIYSLQSIARCVYLKMIGD